MTSHGKRLAGFILAGLAVALLLAGVVSSFASDEPDGLEHVATDGCTLDENDEIVDGECIATEEDEHEIDGPLPDYSVPGVDNEFLSTAISGVTGVAAVFIVGGGVFWLLRRRDRGAEREPTS